MEDIDSFTGEDLFYGEEIPKKIMYSISKSISGSVLRISPYKFQNISNMLHLSNNKHEKIVKHTANFHGS
jgi:hypothetical protein